MARPNPLWTLGAVGIHVDEYSLRKEPVYGEQHVLDADVDTKHYSGSHSRRGSIGGMLYTSGSTSPELSTLEGYCESSTARTLTEDTGHTGSYNVLNIEFERRQALNETYPVYRVRIELSEAS